MPVPSKKNLDRSGSFGFRDFPTPTGSQKKLNGVLRLSKKPSEASIRTVQNKFTQQ